MVGIKETKEVATFITSLAEGIYEAQKGGWSWSDYIHFIKPLGDALPALDGITEVPAELEDLTDEEVAELVEHLKAEFDIDQELAEALVEDALEVGVIIFRMVGRIKASKEA